MLTAAPQPGSEPANGPPQPGKQRRERDERRLVTAYAVSQMGSGIGAGALPLVAILLLDASDWQVSLLVALAGIAAVAVVLPMGPWLEFHRKRPAMIAADVGRAVALVSVPVAAVCGLLTYGQLCLVATLQTVGAIVSSAASAAHLKNLVPAHRLAPVTSRLETVFWTASSVGPPAGGLLVAWLGPLVALVADAASFVLSAFGVRRIRRPEPAPPTRDPRRHPIAEMAAGWRCIAAHPGLRPLFVHAMIFGGCIRPPRR